VLQTARARLGLATAFDVPTSCIIHDSQLASPNKLPCPNFQVASSRRPFLPSRSRCHSACSSVVAARPRRAPLSQRRGRPTSRPVSRPGSQVLNPIIQGRRRNRPRSLCALFCSSQFAEGPVHKQQRASGAEATTVSGAHAIHHLASRVVWRCAPTRRSRAATTPHSGSGAHFAPRYDDRIQLRVPVKREH
jgi:hypothetical protein